MKSKSNISDFISRHPISDERWINENIYENYINFITTTAFPNSLTINERTAKPEDWKQWLNLLKKLNFDHETFNLIKRYRKSKDILTVNLDNDIILKDNCIILPDIFHKTLIKLAHIGHQGIQKTKALMRSKVFFLGMDNALENEITRNQTRTNICATCYTKLWRGG